MAKTREELEQVLSQYNQTELVEIAKFCGFPGFNTVGPSKGVPRAVLTAMLIDFEPLPEVEALLATRERIESFVKPLWDNFKSQAADKQCPECIHGTVDAVDGKHTRCSDLAVAECFIKNRGNIP